MQTKNLILTALFASLTAVGAFLFLPLPFSPVPITLQLLFTFLAGGILGSKYGSLSQIIYILLGAAGLPVFAGGRAGLSVLVGPTAGFIYGFVIAAWIAGKMKGNFFNRMIYLLTGLIIVYILGTGSLMITTGMGFTKALTVGTLPFLIGDLFKVFAAVYLIPILKKHV